MTHAESRDLLLDLAYGELDAARAAEVSEHLKGCDECRKEKAALDDVRRAAAPLRELEEPPPGFDDRILEAARAEAHLEHGNVGQVVEVTGSVQPLGLDAGRIDAHAKVEKRGERRRPRWMVRAAVAGSVATAAALAVVVSTAVQSGRTTPAARPEEYQIRVQPAPQAVDTALREAEAKRDQPPAQSAPPAAPAPAKPAENAAELRKAAPPSRRAKVAQVEGSGGDAADSNLASGGRGAAEKKAESADLGPAASVASSAPAQSRVAEQSAPAVAAAARPMAGAGAAENRARSKAVTANEPGPDRLEAQAQEARHGGNYQVAARLYRDAAALRRDQDEATAAWDLAHAVECLAAAGLFDEARAVRQELAQSYPAQPTALSAARRALREFDAPAAPGSPADPNR